MSAVPRATAVTIPVSVVLAVLAALGLSVLFWGELWLGGGLVGGDIYTYYFPQKLFLVERLAAGEFPLWNSWVGHGYPLIAESQTAALSPFTQLAYRLWNLNAAYNAVQLTHYVLAFLFAWMYARALSLGAWGSALAALVYTYSWFPPRIVLEWAIVGGAWLPLALWGVERFLQSDRWRYAAVTTLALTLQLLAGHFNLAFITLLTLVAYVPLRIVLARRSAATIPPSTTKGDPPSRGELQAAATNPPRWRPALVLAGAVLAAYGLAAVQLLPTWELKRASQRASVGEAHQPGYGHIPVWYWTQVVAPWSWYREDVDLNAGLPPGSPPTNKVEAHLYFGLIPVLLMVTGLFTAAYRGDRRWMLWAILGFAALLYTPGWFVPLTKHLPGFSFFIGPGRYGIVTTLAAGLLAGRALEAVLARRGSVFRALLLLVVFVGTVADLWVVSGRVTYAMILPEPFLDSLPHSPVRRILQAADREAPVRLFSRGANLPTLLGVASTPVYLGIGPEAYFDPATRMPEPLPFDAPPTPEQIRWLRNAGVTHVLSFSKLNPSQWPVTFLWGGVDPFLNRAWARPEPLYLYRLEGSRGRVAWQETTPGNAARVIDYRANEVVIEAESAEGGLLILTDLAWPGWRVSVDESPAGMVVVDEMYRGVQLAPGKHRVRWKYVPASLWGGMGITAGTLLLLAGLAIARRQRSRAAAISPPER